MNEIPESAKPGIEWLIENFPETWENRPGGLKDALKKLVEKPILENEKFTVETIYIDHMQACAKITLQCDLTKNTKIQFLHLFDKVIVQKA